MATLDQLVGRPGHARASAAGWLAEEYDGVRHRRSRRPGAAPPGRGSHPVRARAAHPGRHQLRRRVLHADRRAVRAEAGAGAAAALDRRRWREGHAAHRGPARRRVERAVHLARRTTPARSACSSGTATTPDRDPADDHPVGERRHRVQRRSASRRSSATSPTSCGPGVLTGSVAGDGRPGRRRTATPGAEWLILADARAVRRRRPRPLRRRGAPAARVTRAVSELRLDPLTREWVAIVADRQDRPNLAPSEAAEPPAACPFCVGGLEAPEPYTVRAFENRWPPFAPGDPIDADGALADASGFVPLPARGAAEVVLYSPDHDGSLATIGDRPVRARRRPLGRAHRGAARAARRSSTCSCSRTAGALVGATIPHPHGQIYGFPFVPPVPRREAEVAAEHGCPVCAAVARRGRRRRARRARRTTVAHVRAVRVRRIPTA